MKREILSTQNKALIINLNTRIFGTLAEIGGGQEVARHFFRAGGASGTIAKTISAYDKKYSDYLYKGKAKRYVSRERLMKMLEVEFQEVMKLLYEERGEQTAFFAFANTVETLNFKKDNEGHGWLGIQFQHEPLSPSNQIILHVSLKENDTILQQNTLGILGINLIYAAYYYSNDIQLLLASLMDNLSTDRLDINMLSFDGPLFRSVDNRIISLLLVKMGYTPASVFDRYGNLQHPGDFFYKKNIMLLRGSFRPPNYVHFDMLKAGFSLFKKDVNFSVDTSLVLCEITLNNLLKSEIFDEKDYLDRVILLNEMGQNVLVSNFKEFYKVSQFICRYPVSQLRLILGANILERIFDDEYYTDLKGGILEAMGRLFSKNVKLYIYPFVDEKNRYIDSNTFSIKKQNEWLLKFLKENEKIIDIPNIKKQWLHIKSDDIICCIRHGSDEWKSMVPVFISKRIEERKLFGCG
ncbi:MAG: hypothetical protein N2449_04700 [Bacteroidales bacterium]|nr:hypothetical protein [Bacteroidales bacterium]